MIKLDRTEQKRKLNAPYTGPYRLLKNYNNGTVKIKRGVYEENIHIRRLKPYKKKQTKKQKTTNAFSLGGEYLNSETPCYTVKSQITKNDLF